eukprot:7283845-Pyramimonas_sp.AAC.1
MTRRPAQRGAPRPLGLDTDIYGVRKELAGELNFRVTRWLNKVLTAKFTVSVSSPTVREGAGGRC